MSIERPLSEAIYPESDGQPMGETDLHIDWIIRLRDMLKLRYAGRQVYVGSDLIVYFEAGVPSSYVVPDCFVAIDCDPGRRRTFKIWEEGRVPNVVFEITSLSSRDKDSEVKPQIYSEIGVAEYFVYDPLGEYLDPALQGHRLTETRKYEALRPDDRGALISDELGVSLQIEQSDLALTDIKSGRRLRTSSEAEREAREAAEAELERLRQQVRELGGDA